MKFFADISLWWLIPWALFCALLAWWYYRKQRAILDASPRKKVLLRALRAIGIFVLGLLLVGLLIEDIESKSQRPVLITLVDNSVSMLNYSDSSEVQKRIDGFQKQLKAKYGDRFDIVEYSIGTEFGKNKGFNENGSIWTRHSSESTRTTIIRI